MSFSNFKHAFLDFFRLKKLSTLLFFCFLFLSAQTLRAGVGTLDPTFGTGGKVLTTFDGLNADYGSNIAQQADGKIVMAGSILLGNFNRQICLVRYNTNGSLDTSFGTEGKVIADLPRREDFATAVAIQSDGRIVVTGYTADFNPKISFADFAALRYNPNGTPDTSFDGDGVKIVDLSGYEYLTDMVIQPDGKIVAVGWSVQGATAVRFNTDGSLDATFSVDGIAGTLLPGFSSFYVNNVALQPDGKIVLSGTGDFTTWFVIRYFSNGTADTSFDGDGMVTTQIGATGAWDSDLVVQPDGKIIVAGHSTATLNNSTSDIALTRYNVNGLLDTSFDGDGKVFKHVGEANLNDQSLDVALQQHGKIVVLANLNNVPNSGTPHALWGILRFNSNGSLDTAFSDDGVETTSVTGVEDIASSMLIQADGKIVVNGRTGHPSVFALVRFNARSETPFDFDGDGKTDLSIYRPTDGQWWILKSSNSENNVFQFGVSSDKIVPADYTGDGRTDIAVWRPATGEWFILRSEDYSYYAFQFGLSGDIPSAADFDGDSKADAGIFRPSNGVWYINKSSGGYLVQQFGQTDDIPVAADYDGDGRADIAVYRPSMDTWWLSRSTDGTIAVRSDVGVGEIPVTGDFTGDGKADCTSYLNDGSFNIILSENGAQSQFFVGANGDIPALGDYDGDGKTNLAVFRPSTGMWRVRNSTTGTIVTQSYGISTDKPVPSAFVP